MARQGGIATQEDSFLQPFIKGGVTHWIRAIRLALVGKYAHLTIYHAMMGDESIIVWKLGICGSYNRNCGFLQRKHTGHDAILRIGQRGYTRQAL